MIDLAVRLNVGIVREDERHRCSVCRLRRVVYRVGVATLFDGDVTDARCWECWTGHREPAAVDVPPPDDDDGGHD